MIDININSGLLLYKLYCILNNGQSTKSKKVHFQKS